MSCPVEQQLFLKTPRRRADGVEGECCQALAWMEPLGKGWSLHCLREQVLRIKTNGRVSVVPGKRQAGPVAM